MMLDLIVHCALAIFWGSWCARRIKSRLLGMLLSFLGGCLIGAAWLAR